MLGEDWAIIQVLVTWFTPKQTELVTTTLFFYTLQYHSKENCSDQGATSPLPSRFSAKNCNNVAPSLTLIIINEVELRFFVSARSGGFNGPPSPPTVRNALVLQRTE